MIGQGDLTALSDAKAKEATVPNVESDKISDGGYTP